MSQRVKIAAVRWPLIRMATDCGTPARQVRVSGSSAAATECADEDIGDTVAVAGNKVGGEGIEDGATPVGAQAGSVVEAIVVGLGPIAGHAEADRACCNPVVKKNVSGAVGVAGN